MKTRLYLAGLFLFGSVGSAFATVYSLPTNGDNVITQFADNVAVTRVEHDETLLDVARRFLLGQEEIVRLNHDLDRWHIKKGEVVRISNRRILPDTPHQGITLNIAEYRMYYYPKDRPGMVYSFAHGVGRQDWKTPLGQTSVARKVKDPSWHPPESIRREHAANGDFLPEVVPPGPHNPLGAYALYLNLPGEYRIHGTDIDKIYGIGMQITHGCVRMYPEDIEELYQMVDVGTPVYIVKQPIKVGWLNNRLYIEAHPDLEGDEMTQDQRYTFALSLIQKATHSLDLPEFDQQALNKALKDLDGNPTVIYERDPASDPIIPIAPPMAVKPIVAKPVAMTKTTSKVVAKPVKKPALPPIKGLKTKTGKVVKPKTPVKPTKNTTVAVKGKKASKH